MENRNKREQIWVSTLGPKTIPGLVPVMPGALLAPQFCSFSSHKHILIFSDFSEGIERVCIQLFLEKVTWGKEAGLRKSLSCLPKTLFSNHTLSGWHDNIPVLFCWAFEALTLCGLH